MLGLLRKLNFSEEKLSRCSLMFVLETMGTSSPEMVPAVGGNSGFIHSVRRFHREINWDTTDEKLCLTKPSVVACGDNKAPLQGGNAQIGRY